jgi:predicted ArsR family transcriptional regulator
MEGKLGNWSEETYFPTWGKGREKRLQIIEMMEEIPGITTSEIANRLKISVQQTRRHLSRLRQEGVILA